MSLDCFIELFIELLLKGGYLMRFTVKLEQLFEAVKAIIRTLPISQIKTSGYKGRWIQTHSVREWPKSRHSSSKPTMYYFQMPADTPPGKNGLKDKRADLSRLICHRDAVLKQVRKGQ
jgi:hypothetical protein